MKGSANSLAGLKKCEKHFLYTSKEIDKLLIIVTEGVADSDPYHISDQLRNSVNSFPLIINIFINYLYLLFVFTIIKNKFIILVGYLQAFCTVF